MILFVQENIRWFQISMRNSQAMKCFTTSNNSRNENFRDLFTIRVQVGKILTVLITDFAHVSRCPRQNHGDEEKLSTISTVFVVAVRPNEQIGRANQVWMLQMTENLTQQDFS